MDCRGGRGHQNARADFSARRGGATGRGLEAMAHGQAGWDAAAGAQEEAGTVRAAVGTGRGHDVCARKSARILFSLRPDRPLEVIQVSLNGKS